MPDARLCCVAWCQDVVECSDVRTSSSPFLSTMEDSWALTSGATDGLECSEDMAFEDMNDLSEALQNASIPMKHHAYLPPSWAQPSEEVDIRAHIRVDLQIQEDFCNLRCFSGSRLSSSAPFPTALQIIDAAAMSPASLKSQTHGYNSPYISPAVSSQSVYPTSRTPPNRYPSQAFETSASSPTNQLATDRQLLVGWMLQLAAAAGLQRETLFGAASLLDRFLNERYRDEHNVQPSEEILQLLAMACVSLAIKMEEVCHMQTNDLLRLAAHPNTSRPLYQAADLGRMEWVLLQTVGWRAHVPTPHTFMQHLLAALVAPGNTNTTTQSVQSMQLAVDAPTLVGDRDDAETYRVSGPDYWGHHLAAWASAFLDMALVYVTPLAHRPSTLAMACLLMASTCSAGPDATFTDASTATGVGPATAAVARALTTMAGGPPTPEAAPLGGESRINRSSNDATTTIPSTTSPASPFRSSGAASPAAERFRLLLRTVVAVTGLPVDQLAPGLTSCVGELEGILQRQRQAAAEMAAAVADVGM